MLSTYNGQKYIREQLDSLYAQKDVEIHILVRDDGSKDSTVDILKEYQTQYGKMTIHADENVGAAKSFYRLLMKAKADLDKYAYYAFCDQDDVWNNDKLSYSVESLESQNGKYKLFYSNVILTDSNLSPISKTRSLGVKTLQNNIIGNRQLGCTQVFNYELFEKITDGILKAEYTFGAYFPLHDVWTSLVAFAYDADIVYGNVPTMCYRQHEANVVGGEKKSFFKTWLGRFSRMYRCPNYKSLKCNYILKTYDDIPEESKDILRKCANYKSGVRQRLHLAFDRSFHCNSFVENLGFTISVLLGRF